MSNDKLHQLDQRYLRMTRIWTENSYCHRRRVGALMVEGNMIISDGHNGTPNRSDNVCEDESGVTHPYVLHMEVSAIAKLAQSSNNSDGSTPYMTALPFIECAELIIQADTKRVMYVRKYRLKDGINLLKRAGIEVIYLNINDNETK